MDTKYKIVDECEGQIEFSGIIQITRESYLEFEKELQELIEKYAI